jgi:hypothetical protein
VARTRLDWPRSRGMCTLRDPSRDRTQKEEYLSGDHLALSVAADSDSGAAKADFESLNSAELGEYFPPNSSDDVVRCGWLLTEQSTRTPTTATCRLVGGRRTPGGWRCRATVTGKPTCTTRRGPRLTSDDHPCPQRRGNIRLVWPPNHVRSDQWSDPGRVWDQPSGPGPPLGRGSLHRSTKPPRRPRPTARQTCRQPAHIAPLASTSEPLCIGTSTGVFLAPTRSVTCIAQHNGPAARVTMLAYRFLAASPGPGMCSSDRPSRWYGHAGAEHR